MTTTTSHYARAAVKGALRLGIDIHALLREANIDSKHFIQHADTRIHQDQLSHLIQLLWQTLQDEFMGFTAHKCKQGSFAMMSELVSHCDNLDGLFRRAIAFYQLITDDIVMHTELHDDDFIFYAEMTNPELDPDHFYLEFWLVIWHRFASWMIGKQIPLKRVNFCYVKPAHANEFPLLFPCEHRFKQSHTCLIFDKRFLQESLIRTQRELAYFLKNSPMDLMTIPGENTSFHLKIKRLIVSSMQAGGCFPSLDSLALSLHLSTQTLRRKLHAEGTYYRRIKDDIRRDIAIEKLCVQNLAVADIALLLGFADARSFSRAFKQWTGYTPSSYYKRPS